MNTQDIENQNMCQSENMLNRRVLLGKLLFLIVPLVLSAEIAFFVDSKKIDEGIVMYGKRHGADMSFNKLSDCDISEKKMAYDYDKNVTSYFNVGNCYAYFATKQGDPALCAKAESAFPEAFTIAMSTNGTPIRKSTSNEKKMSAVYCSEGVGFRLGQISKNCDFCNNLTSSSSGHSHRDHCMSSCAIALQDMKTCNNVSDGDCEYTIVSGRGYKNALLVGALLASLLGLFYLIGGISGNKIAYANNALMKSSRNLSIALSFFIAYILIAAVYLAMHGQCRLMETCGVEVLILVISIPFVFLVLFFFSVRYLIDALMSSNYLSNFNKILSAVTIIIWSVAVYLILLNRF